MGLVAAIAGASGFVGSHALDALLTEVAYERVVTLVRRPLDFDGTKLLQAVVDFFRYDKNRRADGEDKKK